MPPDINCLAFTTLSGSSKIQFFDKLRFGHKAYRIQPSHNAFCQHPTVNDTLASRAISGTAVLKNNKERFTETGVIFEETYEISFQYFLNFTKQFSHQKPLIHTH
uniref:Flavin-containing monooxygenase n=1 Tax=Tetranychus urticae TaxID=32264 RepID=T1K8U9_TETUR